MSRLIAAVAIAAVAALAPPESTATTTTPAPPPPAPYPAKFHTTPAHAFVDGNGIPAKVNGFNIFPVFSDGTRWGSEHYKAIAAKGFTAVRFFMPWAYYEPTKGSFRWLDKLDAAVAAAKTAGLYVVMDFPGTDRWNKGPAWSAVTTAPAGSCVNNDPDRKLDR